MSEIEFFFLPLPHLFDVDNERYSALLTASHLKNKAKTVISGMFRELSNYWPWALDNCFPDFVHYLKFVQ